MYRSGNDEAFKGTLYGPAKYLTEKARQYRMMNSRELAVYRKQVKASRGYDVDGCTGCLPGGIFRVNEDYSSYSYWMDAIHSAKYATRKHGEVNNRSFKFVRLVKANAYTCTGAVFYLTFTAEDTADGAHKSFRAKVWNNLVENTMQLQEMTEFKGPDCPLSKDDRISAAGNSNKRPRRPGKEVGSTSSVTLQVSSPIKRCQKVRACTGKMPSSRPAKEVESTSSKVASPSKKSQRVEADLGERRSKHDQDLPGISILLQLVKNDKGPLTRASARNLASEKWKLLSPDEKETYLRMAAFKSTSKACIRDGSI